MRLPAQQPLNIIPGLISASVMQNILRLSELAPYGLARGVDVDVSMQLTGYIVVHEPSWSC